jgi:hypothetical protein
MNTFSGGRPAFEDTTGPSDYLLQRSPFFSFYP